MDPRPLLALLLASTGALTAESVTLTVLSTTDLHGNLLGYDYLTGRVAARGLARAATLIEQERKRSPNTLLVDCGDTIQGAPLEAVYQHYVRHGGLPMQPKGKAAGLDGDPMMRAMNLLRFDAMAVGNHEYNFGLRNLDAARATATFPWLSANTTVEPSSGRKPYDAHVVRTVGGVKVAIIGLTTPSIPTWEKPENYAGYRFHPAVEAARRAVAEVRAKERPDVVVIAAHMGLDRNLRSGQPTTGNLPHENEIHQVATEVNGVDLILFGHTHQQLAEAEVGGALLAQAKNWGMALASVDVTLEREGSGPWRVTGRKGRLLPVTMETPEDPRLVALAQPYHEATERFLQTPVNRSEVALEGTLGRVQDSALVDAIHQVQLHYAKADVSLSALFNPRVAVRPGPVTVRELAGLYLYDNELYAIEGNGRMLREALENAARFYRSCPTPACEGPLINREVIGYNFDTAQGVEYTIDLTRPEGQRIRDLRYRGQLLRDEQPLRIALNNYRYGGSGGYGMFRDAEVVYRSGAEIRDLLIEYYTTRPLPSSPDDNWRVVPVEARRALEQEALRDASRTITQ